MISDCLNGEQTMNRSQNSGKESNASSEKMRFGTTIGDVKCHCGKPALVIQAWTDDNPGRRFYKCGDVRSCNFFYGLMLKNLTDGRIALMEARDVICE